MDAVDYYSICKCGVRYLIKNSTAPIYRAVYCSLECQLKADNLLEGNG